MTDNWESKQGLYPESREFVGDTKTHYRPKKHRPWLFWLAWGSLAVFLLAVLSVLIWLLIFE